MWPAAGSLGSTLRRSTCSWPPTSAACGAAGRPMSTRWSRPVAELQVKDFLMPGAYSGIGVGVGGFLDRPVRGFLRRLDRLPRPKAGRCTLCAACERACPARPSEWTSRSKGRQGRRLALHPLLLLSRGLPVGCHRPGVQGRRPDDEPAGDDEMSGHAAGDGSPQSEVARVGCRRRGSGSLGVLVTRGCWHPPGGSRPRRGCVARQPGLARGAGGPC